MSFGGSILNRNQPTRRPSNTTASPAPDKSHVLTGQEREAVSRTLARRKHRPLAPKFKVEDQKNGVDFTVVPDHADEGCGYAMLCDALGTGEYTFATGVLEQIAKSTTTIGKGVSERELNFMLATVHQIAPRDATEALLAAQMAAIHNSTMKAARRLNHSDTIPQQDSASLMLNKLARTFTTQVEALKKYRSTGEQSIRVQYVTVGQGGRAIVGNVHPGGGGALEKPSQSLALGATTGTSSADASVSALPSNEQAIRGTLQEPGCERVPRLPDARRTSGRAAGQS